MQICPFCKTYLRHSNTFCEVCGFSFVLPLPCPVLPHRKFYFALSILSIFSGLLSCTFTFIPSLYLLSLLFVMGAIGLAGVTLERTRGKYHALLIKILALHGLLLGVLGYTFMFIHSNVPSSGYSM